MPRDTRKAHGAAGKTDMLLFDPEDLLLVTDETSDLYDDRVHLEPTAAFVANLEHYGVLEPILVRKNTATGKTEVVDGRQRVKGLRVANKNLKKRGEEPWRISAVVKRSDAATAIGMMISTNEQRRDDSPLNRAKKAARMLERGKTEPEVANALGCSSASVKNLIALLDAPAVVRSAVENEKITVSEGYKLAKLDASEARKKVEALIEHAPRTPGKKRSANARKAREIVDGPKATPEAPEGGLREPHIVENVLRELQEHDRNGAGGSALARGAIVALQWVLGDDDALQALGLAKTGSTVAHLYGKGEVPRAAAT
jgi:ParB family chromosome partitioning protein